MRSKLIELMAADVSEDDVDNLVNLVDVDKSGHINREEYELSTAVEENDLTNFRAINDSNK